MCSTWCFYVMLFEIHTLSSLKWSTVSKDIFVGNGVKFRFSLLEWHHHLLSFFSIDSHAVYTGAPTCNCVKRFLELAYLSLFDLTFDLSSMWGNFYYVFLLIQSLFTVYWPSCYFFSTCGGLFTTFIPMWGLVLSLCLFWATPPHGQIFLRSPVATPLNPSAICWVWRTCFDVTPVLTYI